MIDRSPPTIGVHRQVADDAEEIRRAADRILEKGIYQPPSPNIVERAVRWLFRQLGELFPDIGGGPSAGPGSFVLGWLLLIVAGAVILWFLVKVMPSRLPRRKSDEPTVERTVRRQTTRDEWLRLATEAEAEGRWRDAVRCRYRALVAALVDRRELPEDAGATSGEYRSAFRSTAARTDTFGGVSDRFEDVWYGGDSASDDDARGVEGADRLLLERDRGEGTST